MSFEIALSRGEVTIVDDDDFERLSQWIWSCDANGYAVRGQKVYMHRFIMNAPEGMTVDHINGNKLDNRKENLRVCSRAENTRNQKMRKDNTSGYKGVYQDRRTKRWRSVIKFEGKVIPLGSFHNKHDAARAYNAKAVELHGEFALINEVTDGNGNFPTLPLLQSLNTLTQTSKHPYTNVGGHTNSRLLFSKQ